MNQSKPVRVGNQLPVNKPTCSICQIEMQYWKEEGVWLCERCKVVSVPHPTESYKIATTWGRGNTWWEYRFWLSDMSKNKVIVVSENMVAIDVTDIINLSVFNTVLEQLLYEHNDMKYNMFGRGESKLLSFNGMIVPTSFRGSIQLVRALDDIP